MIILGIYLKILTCHVAKSRGGSSPSHDLPGLARIELHQDGQHGAHGSSVSGTTQDPGQDEDQF